MRIGTRILVGYGVALIIFAVVSMIAYRATQVLVQSTNAAVHTYQVRHNLAGVLAALADAETGQRGFLLTGRDQYLAPYREGRRGIDQHLQAVRELTADNPNQQRRLARLQPVILQKLEELGETIALRRQNNQAEAIQAVLTDRGRTYMDEIRSIVGEMNKEEASLLAARTEQANERARLTSQAIAIGMLITLVLTVIIAVLIQRSIVGPLHSFMEVARRVGEGDLTLQTRISRRDELGELAGYLDQMVQSLRDFARQSTLAAENLSAATAEILASAQQQAASTAEQAAAVQQANATMQELGHSGTQISTRAKEVAAAAEAVSSASPAGLDSVRQTDQTMGVIGEQAEAVADSVIALSEKTQAVEEIISSVNDIAEQSHLLALNASIQAAGAGEHGRSFSVVAAEMKNLAAQSKQATVQIRSILGDIQKGINTAVMLTEEALKRADSGRQQSKVADRSIRQLTDKLEESIGAFQQIVAGSGQQQVGFQQMTQAFRNIGMAAQETAASTKQSEKAAANLSGLAQQLRTTVGRYRT